VSHWKTGKEEEFGEDKDSNVSYVLARPSCLLDLVSLAGQTSFKILSHGARSAIPSHDDATSRDSRSRRWPEESGYFGNDSRIRPWREGSKRTYNAKS
jgi:hypothetical protein